MQYYHSYKGAWPWLTFNVTKVRNWKVGIEPIQDIDLKNIKRIKNIDLVWEIDVKNIPVEIQKR